MSKLASSCTGFRCVPCCARNSLAPSIPHSFNIFALPPGCWFAHAVKSYTLPSMVVQHFFAVFAAATSAMVYDVGEVVVVVVVVVVAVGVVEGVVFEVLD